MSDNPPMLTRQVVQHGHHAANRHEPTEETRRLVSHFTSCGVTQADIARYLNIRRQTLIHHYRREMDEARVKVTAEIGKRFIRTALDDKHPMQTTAQIFYLKCWGGWTKPDDHPEDPNNPPPQDDGEDLSDLPPEEAYRRLIEESRTVTLSREDYRSVFGDGPIDGEVDVVSGG